MSEAAAEAALVDLTEPRPGGAGGSVPADQSQGTDRRVPAGSTTS